MSDHCSHTAGFSHCSECCEEEMKSVFVNLALLGNDERLFVPGLWECPTCKYELSRRTISTADGGMGTTAKDREDPEPCPNLPCNGIPLRRVSWKDQAITGAIRLNEEFEEKIKLQEAIRKHRDQKGDDRCWLDDRELYSVLPDAPKEIEYLDPTEMLANCKRFIASRHEPGTPYVSPGQEIKRLSDRVEELQERLSQLGFDKIGADRLADEVSLLIQHGKLDSRSHAGDALLDYRERPTSVRSDRIEGLERQLHLSRAFLTQIIGRLSKTARELEALAKTTGCMNDEETGA